MAAPADHIVCCSWRETARRETARPLALTNATLTELHACDACQVHMLCPDSKKLSRGVTKWPKELSEHVPQYANLRERPKQFIYDDEVVHYKYPRAGGVMKLQWQPP